jgi:hypothetical protein
MIEKSLKAKKTKGLQKQQQQCSGVKRVSSV